MSGPEPEALEDWAESRGLVCQPEDTLPPVTERLRRGVGVGSHRAAYRSISDRGFVVTTGSNRKKPERETVGVCQGILPGGLDGELGHHVHLLDQGRGQENRYLAITDTVVYAELPHRARPVFHLEGAPGGGDLKAAASIGKEGGQEPESPLDGVVPAPKGRAEAGGLVWSSFPAEEDERIRRIVSAATRSLEGLPTEEIEVEYECGKLAVWLKGRAETDPAALESLSRFASKVADGLAEVVGAGPRLEPEQSLPLPAPDARERWVRAGADLVDWDKPPVSVVAAQGRYKKDVKPKARRTGWTVYAIVGTVVFLFGLLIAGASLGLSLLTDELPLGLGLMIAAISVAAGALAANRIALEVGQEVMDERISASATPWGIEAFARGYEEHSGLTREDHDELRRRVAAPFNGRAQIAWQGELTPGTPGHLSVWIDATVTPEPPLFYLLAVTGPTGADAPSGFRSEEADGLRLTWQEVGSVDRAVSRLDELRQVATG